MNQIIFFIAITTFIIYIDQINKINPKLYLS